MLRAPILFFLLSISFNFTSLSFAEVADTPEARKVAVARYLELVPMKKMMDDSVAQVAKTLPVDQQETFIKMTTQNLRFDVLQQAAAASLAKHLTIGEINAFISFMEKPEGRSAMDKMKFYMADMMPVLQAELGRAATLTQSQGASGPVGK